MNTFIMGAIDDPEEKGYEFVRVGNLIDPETLDSVVFDIWKDQSANMWSSNWIYK